MVRSGVILPAVMKLLGHTDPGMSMRYVEVASNDLRHLAPQPKASIITPRAGLDGVVDSLLFAQHAMEMFRRALPDGPARNCPDRVSNQLTKSSPKRGNSTRPDCGQRLAECRIMPNTVGERQRGVRRIGGWLGIIRGSTGTREGRRLA
jgi:hypothetical protein